MLFTTEYELRRGQLAPAELLRKMQDSLQAITRMGGDSVFQLPGGLILNTPNPDSLWIIILGGSGNGAAEGSGNSFSSAWGDNYYDWQATRLTVTDDGLEIRDQDPSGMQGFFNNVPAIEVNGNIDVPPGTIVRAWRSPSGRSFEFEFGGGNAGSGSGGQTQGYTFTCNGDGTGGTLTPGSPGHPIIDPK